MITACDYISALLRNVDGFLELGLREHSLLQKEPFFYSNKNFMSARILGDIVTFEVKRVPKKVGGLIKTSVYVTHHWDDMIEDLVCHCKYCDGLER